MLPTAEVAITNLHRDEILEEADLPLHYVAHTPCFRSEKASAGRDVRGIKRVHQFEKVEMYKFATPESSYEELEAMTCQAEDICAPAGNPFSPAGNRQRRSGIQRDQEIRYRDVVARLPGMARGQLVQQYRNLSGAPGDGTFLPRRQPKDTVRAYAQWQRLGDAAGDDRHPGELSASRWQRDDTASAAPIPGWRGDNRQGVAALRSRI